MNLKILKFVFDPGHGGKDRTNVGPTGYVEADWCLAAARELQKTLMSRYSNVKVFLTRSTDVDFDKKVRGRMAKDADLFHSIHTNGFSDPQSKGSEVFYSVDIPGDRALAADLSLAYSKLVGTNDRGAKTKMSTTHPGEDYYTVIDEAQDIGCPHVILSETCFHSNPIEEAWLKRPESFKEFADVTCRVYEQYFPLIRREVYIPKDTINNDISVYYQTAWHKAVIKGVEDGIGPNEVVTSAKLMAYFDKLGLLD